MSKGFGDGRVTKQTEDYFLSLIYIKDCLRFKALTNSVNHTVNIRHILWTINKSSTVDKSYSSQQNAKHENGLSITEAVLDCRYRIKAGLYIRAEAEEAKSG